jgi:hypothetical protein
LASVSDTDIRLQRIFDEAAALCREKNATYQDSWRTQGWRGNLSRILEKSGRLRAMLWHGGNTLLSGEKEHPRETSLDMINTLAFMIANIDDGKEWGHEQDTLYGEVHAEPEPGWQPRSSHNHPFGVECNQGCPTHSGEWPATGYQLPQNRPGALMDQETAVEQTMHIPVTDVGTPGEESPSPVPRKRKIKDAPQV